MHFYQTYLPTQVKIGASEQGKGLHAEGFCLKGNAANDTDENSLFCRMFCISELFNI